MEMAILLKDSQAALADVAAIPSAVPHLQGVDGSGARAKMHLTCNEAVIRNNHFVN